MGFGVNLSSFGIPLDNSGKDESAVWGNVSGTLSDQTDLQAALDAKVDSPVDLTTDVTGDLPFSNIAQVPTNRIIGRLSSGTGDIEALTLTSVADALEQHIDHGSLQASSLLDDDHTIYALLAGRSGGQTLVGGPDTSDGLTLAAHTGDLTALGFDDTGRVELKSRLRFNEDFTYPVTDAGFVKTWGGSLIDYSGTWTVGADGNAGSATVLQAGFVLEHPATQALSGMALFDARPTIRPIGNVGWGSSAEARMYFSFPTYSPDISTAVTSTAANFGSYVSEVNASIKSGSHASAASVLTSAFGFKSGFNANTTQASITTASHFLANNAVATGPITTQIGLDLANLNSATTNLSLRSTSTTAEMRHAGSAVFGANAAPTNSSVGLEVQSTTKALLLPRMTTTQKNALTAVNGMILYDSTLNKVQVYEGGAWASVI